MIGAGERREGDMAHEVGFAVGNQRDHEIPICAQTADNIGFGAVAIGGLGKGQIRQFVDLVRVVSGFWADQGHRVL